MTKPRTWLAGLLAVLVALVLVPCTALAETSDVAKVGDATYPTLIEALDAAEKGQTIYLLGDYEVETEAYTTYLLPEGSTLDLGGHTLTVPYAAACFEGMDATIQNGSIDSNESYAIWIGNGENNTSITLKNVASNAGVNVYAAEAILEDCSIDASASEYYAAWADNGATITIKSGTYVGGTNGYVVDAQGGADDDNRGSITIEGGTFEGAVKVESTDSGSGVLAITGGTFSEEVPEEYVADNVSVTKLADGSYTVVVPTQMYRIYNPNSGEHFYTANAAERDNLVKVGWKYEGVGWTAPSVSSTPVYRLYSGTDHHYTTSASEKDVLVKAGWKYEGIGWYSDDAKGVEILREFNPNVDPTAARNNSGSHNFTTSAVEHANLISVGWIGEGVAWYGLAE